ANLLTRATAVLAASFLAMSLILAIIAGRDRDSGSLMQPVATDSALPSPTAPGLGDLPPPEPAPSEEPEIPLR
ncbi:MAG: preprotein translocase subunit SecG, partial [Alphaproteobacteria bacterium]